VIVKSLQELSEQLQSIPIVKSILAVCYERIFATSGYGMFRGVYRDFQEATLAAPNTKKLGFDHEEFCTFYQDRLKRIFPEDYPVLFWLRPILGPGCRVFDFGGHRGHHFYAYSRFVSYPQDFCWTVCDVTVVVRAGRTLAREKGESGRLRFTIDFQEADGATIFLAAGSIHYVESPPLADALATLKILPRHLILNKLPLYGGRPYVSLQNGRVAFHPLHVYNREEFIASLGNLGYDLVDEWAVPTRHGRIPFHSEASFPSYTGIYLRLRG
jgi:putative methyltransferase (TIGR04325 family)